MTASSPQRTVSVGDGTVTLAKYEGVGNDFLVLVDPDRRQAPDAALARRACDRRLGIGADGLIWATGAAGDDFDFRLWNADGSEAEMSGNGLRCLAQAVVDAGLVEGWAGVGSHSGAVRLGVHTPAGYRPVVMRPLGAGAAWSAVGMGVVSVEGCDERCNVGAGHLVVDVGNPHLVVAGPDPRTIDIVRLGAELQESRPGGINVEFVTLGPGRDEVTMRVYERGVGETQACGTGSVAAATAFSHWGRVGRTVTVNQPGGAVEVTLAADGSATLAGPSRWVATCVFPLLSAVAPA